jgi:phosphoribosylaminoimidazole carboxylase PurE protein
LEISSAHRNPEKTAKLAKEAAHKGYQAIIAACGNGRGASRSCCQPHELTGNRGGYAGVEFNGIDALLSMSQMPAGIPVGVVAIGKPGARNAAILAARIIAIAIPGLQKKLSNIERKLNRGDLYAGINFISAGGFWRADFYYSGDLQRPGRIQKQCRCGLQPD